MGQHQLNPVGSDGTQVADLGVQWRTVAALGPLRIGEEWFADVTIGRLLNVREVVDCRILAAAFPSPAAEEKRQVSHVRM